MEQLSLVPVCEKHGCEKVWVNDRSNRNGGFFRCRKCNAEDSRRRNARNRANPEKRDQLNADARRRWKEQPEEKRKARIDQCVAYATKRSQENPEVRERKYEHTRRWYRRNREQNRDNNLKKTYGITQADYERMLEQQGGVCAICGSSDPKARRNSTHFHVDHCHDTGVVRGLLCTQCNQGLGCFGDNVDTLLAAVVYLSERALGAPTEAA